MYQHQAGRGKGDIYERSSLSHSTEEEGQRLSAQHTLCCVIIYQYFVNGNIPVVIKKITSNFIKRQNFQIFSEDIYRYGFAILQEFLCPPAGRINSYWIFQSGIFEITEKLFFWNLAASLMKVQPDASGSHSFISFHTNLKNKSQPKIFVSVLFMSVEILWTIMGLRKMKREFHMKARKRRAVIKHSI